MYLFSRSGKWSFADDVRMPSKKKKQKFLLLLVWFCVCLVWNAGKHFLFCSFGKLKMLSRKIRKKRDNTRTDTHTHTQTHAQTERRARRAEEKSKGKRIKVKVKKYATKKVAAAATKNTHRTPYKPPLFTIPFLFLYSSSFPSSFLFYFSFLVL